MKIEKFTLLILVGLLFLSIASLAANAQNMIPVNEPYNQAQPANIVPPASFAQQPYSYAEPYANAAGNSPNSAPTMSGPQGVAPYGAPYGAGVPYAATPYAGGVPCGGAPCVGTPLIAPIVPALATPVVGPFTNSFTYSNQQSSAFGPFTPPVTQASEQFYQYPGLTPFGAYPGAGFAATGGVGFDPMSGYYGPFGAYTPL